MLRVKITLFTRENMLVSEVTIIEYKYCASIYRHDTTWGSRNAYKPLADKTEGAACDHQQLGNFCLAMNDRLLVIEPKKTMNWATAVPSEQPQR